MASTLLLDQVAWDLLLDASGNIAVASEPYALAQDAASAIKTFRGECFWNTLLGVPYLTDVLAKRPSSSLLKALFVEASKTVEGVVDAKCYLTALENRKVSGQIQVMARTTGQVAAITFTTTNPQGA